MPPINMRTTTAAMTMSEMRPRTNNQARPDFRAGGGDDEYGGGDGYTCGGNGVVCACCAAVCACRALSAVCAAALASGASVCGTATPQFTQNGSPSLNSKPQVGQFIIVYVSVVGSLHEKMSSGFGRGAQAAL